MRTLAFTYMFLFKSPAIGIARTARAHVHKGTYKLPPAVSSSQFSGRSASSLPLVHQAAVAVRWAVDHRLRQPTPPCEQAPTRPTAIPRPPIHLETGGLCRAIGPRGLRLVLSYLRRAHLPPHLGRLRTLVPSGAQVQPKRAEGRGGPTTGPGPGPGFGPVVVGPAAGRNRRWMMRSGRRCR